MNSLMQIDINMKTKWTMLSNLSLVSGFVFFFFFEPILFILDKSTLTSWRNIIV